MTEEERQKTILELERAVCKPIPKRRVAKCECCGEPLIKGSCPDHASYMRSHQVALNTIREQNEMRITTPENHT